MKTNERTSSYAEMLKKLMQGEYQYIQLYQ